MRVRWVVFSFWQSVWIFIQIYIIQIYFTFEIYRYVETSVTVNSSVWLKLYWNDLDNFTLNNLHNFILNS